MADRVRAFDWTTTPLGPIADWPDPLKTLTALMLASRQPMFIAWGPQRIWLHNDAFIPIAGDKHPRGLGRTAAEVWAEIQGEIGPIFAQVFAGQAVQMGEIALRIDRSGALEECHFAFSYTPIFGQAGAVAGLFGTCIETTAQVIADRERHRSEARLRLATENAEVGLWDIDPDENISFFYAVDAFSMPQDRKTPWKEFLAHVHPEDEPTLSAAYAAARDPYRRDSMEVEYRTLPVGDVPARWLAVKGRGIFDGQGRYVGMSGTAIDITKPKLAELQLRHGEEKLRLATDSAEIGLWDMDVVHNSNHPDVRVKAMFGLSPDAEQGAEEYFAQIHPDDVESVLAAYRAAFDSLERPVYDVEYRVRGKDGITRWIAAKGRGVFDVEGTCVRAIGTAMDITARKQIEQDIRDLNETLERRVAERTAALEKSEAQIRMAEQALQQAQKMEAIGNLTGGIAHDFNNLLQGVAGSLDLIRRKPDDAERVRRWAESGLQAADRGAKLTAQLLAFSRAQKLELRPLDLPALLSGMWDLLSRTLGRNVSINLDLDPDCGNVMGDETQIELAVLNLAINARDAMPDGGSLNIATRRYRDSGDTQLAAGDYVVLTVTDTGSGMSPHVAARAFDPFFTTKGLGKGTGLGLSQVYGMAQQAGGTARIHSVPGRGTTVSIFIPFTDSPIEAAISRSEGAKAADARATILVVDDDRDVRRFLAESLDSLGYLVLQAEDGPAGLDALSRHTPDVIILDYAMPGMTGAEVAQRMRTNGCVLPIVFASGYAETDALQDFTEEAFVLRKPFRIEELQDVLHSALRR
jgi:PAS domain S-box-containing protein